MRRNRMILGSLWILSLIAISFYGGTISYSLFFVLTAIPIMALIYVGCVYIWFRVYQQVLVANVVAGTPTPFIFKLQNETKFAFAGIRIHFFTFFSQITGIENDSEYELLPGETLHKETQIICKYRGDYEIGIKTLDITDYLRLFTIRFKPKETVMASVKPAVIHLEELRTLELQTTFPKEIMWNPTIPDMITREYVPTDPMKLISWKATARTNTLQVRKLLGEDQQGMVLLMDTDRSSTDPREYLPMENKVLETTIALCLYMTTKHMECSVRYMAESLRNVSLQHIGRFDDFYGEMSGAQFDGAYGFAKNGACFLEDTNLLRAGIVIMVLQSMCDNIQRLIETLVRQNVQVMVYLISAKERKEESLIHDARCQIVTVDVQDSLQEVL